MARKKALVALDSFKGTFSSDFLGATTAAFLGNSDYIVVSDGGEGFVEAVLANQKKAKVFFLTSTDDTGQKTRVKLARVGSDAYLEVASLVGLNKKPGLSAVHKTDYGVGSLIRKIEKIKWIRRVFIGLGGSSVSKAGFDAFRGAGCRFDDKRGHLIDDYWRAGEITKTTVPAFRKKYFGCTDVKNPLLGPNGAAVVYGAQKFMSRSECARVEAGNEAFAKAFDGNYAKLEGAGAAGGLGFFIAACLKGKLISGMEMIATESGFARRSLNYEVVVVGEGRFDDQSTMGKAVGRLTDLSANKKVVLFAGDIAPKARTSKYVGTVQLRKKNESLKSAIASKNERLLSGLSRLKKLIQTLENDEGVRHRYDGENGQSSKNDTQKHEDNP